MADESTETETTDAPDAVETPDAAEAAGGVETPDAADAVGAVEATEAVADETSAPTEPEEQLHPKEARARVRQRSGTQAQPARTPEERHEARRSERAAKAKARTRRRGQERDKRVARRTEIPAPTPPVEHPKGQPKTRQGVVTSSKADKTITVRVDAARRHRRYEKIVRSSTTLHAHDEANDAHEGDTVTIVECRPLSRLKRWRLVEVNERAR